MVSGTQLLEQRPPVRMILVGYPGAGKTGSLASLIDAGFKLRFVAFEPNYQPLIEYADPEMLRRDGALDIQLFEDEFRAGTKFVEVFSATAFNRAMHMLRHWKIPGEGKDAPPLLDLGRSAEWGPDTVVVIDSMTSQGEAAFRRALNMLNRTPQNATRTVWNTAMHDTLAFYKELNSLNKNYHVIVLAHLRMIGPEEVEADDDEVTKGIKKTLASMVPTRLFPRAITKGMSTEIHKEFTTMIQAEQMFGITGKGRRVLRTVPRVDLDLKIPAKSIKDEYPLETGLAEIFAALGHPGPGRGAAG